MWSADASNNKVSSINPDRFGCGAALQDSTRHYCVVLARKRASALVTSSLSIVVNASF